jgi:hypothetical protein
MVTPQTTELLVVVYAPVEIAKPQLLHVLQVTGERLALIVGGHETASTAG